MQSTLYSFRVSVAGEAYERTMPWLEKLAGTYPTLKYDLFREVGYCYVFITVEEPSDLYIEIHNARRRGLIEEYTVSENTEK